MFFFIEGFPKCIEQCEVLSIATMVLLLKFPLPIQKTKGDFHIAHVPSMLNRQGRTQVKITKA